MPSPRASGGPGAVTIIGSGCLHESTRVSRFLGGLEWLNSALWNALSVVLVAAAALTWNANWHERR